MLTLFLSLAIALATPCATEDSTNCYWNDGTGRAFVTVGPEDHRLTIYRD